MREVIDLAVAEAGRRQATAVHGVTLRVGALAGVDPDALAFAFDVAAAGTPAAGATLTIEPVPVVCYCPGCAREFAPGGVVYACPACGTPSRDVRQGTELELVRLEVS